MNDGSQTNTRDASRFLPLMMLLFAASGCSALIYEIVWYQMLQLAIGSTSISLGYLLAAYMGGLCIGSIGLAKVKAANGHPLKVYAKLEAGIAALAILVLLGMPLLDRIYIASSVAGMPGMLLRGLMAAICLLPPTILMGASLPVLSRWIEASPSGVAWWGLLYGGNTAGAVLGCLAAGFYLLRIYNVAVATWVAVAINLFVAAISWLLAARTPMHASAETAEEQAATELVREKREAKKTAAAVPDDRWTIYVTIAISGATALGAEVVWTRLMGMMLGATVYVFAIILAVFLVGLALGSAIGSWAQRAMNPRLALGWSQILLTLGIAWTAYMIADSLPYWPINPLLTISPWHTFQLDMARCFWAMLPPTILWGASFPLALGAVAERPDPSTERAEDPGAVVGGVYAANTLGAIGGALVTSLILIPWLNTQNTERVILLLSAVSAVIVLVPYIFAKKSADVAAWLTASLVLAGFLAWSVDAVPGKLIAYGRKMPINMSSSQVLYTVDGINSSIAITQWNDGATEIDVNGHVEATTEPYDMKLQRMVGHLPALLHPNPKSVLGIGFGAGVSAGTFTRYPGIEHITICEIEPKIPPTSTRFFAQADYNVMNNPRTHIVYDDARHFVLTTPQTFDIIASDPLDVFVKGTAALYSKEYFESVKKHLNPGGMFSLYVPLYESDELTVRSELATFFDVFPYGTVWANTVNGQGYDMVFMGQAEPLKIDLDDVQKRYIRADYAAVAESLREIGVNSPVELFATYAGQKADLGAWVGNAPVTHDEDLRLQYIGGWSINSSMEDQIYRNMLNYRKAPQNLFIGSPAQVQAMLYAMTLGGQQP